MNFINKKFFSAGNLKSMPGPVFCACLLAAVLQLAGCASVDATEEGSLRNGVEMAESAPYEASGLDKADIEEKWGIRIIGIRRTAAGYMLDFRYRVIDPEKAVSLLDREKKAYVIDQKSGIRLTVPSPPKIGSLRQSTGRIKPDRDYFILFSNPGGMVKQGMKVTLVIGDFRAENLTVK